MNSWMKVMSAAVMIRPRYFHSDGMLECGTAKTGTQERCLKRAHSAPHWCGGRFRIARCQQQLRLMCFQAPRRLLSDPPPLKPPLRQTFLRQPKSLAVIDQNTDRRPAPAAEQEHASCPAPAAEQEHASRKWIGLK